MNNYRDLNEFLARHSANKSDAKDTPSLATHTRIPDKQMNVYGGSYIIPPEDIQTFMKLYYEQVFTKNKLEYLTEKQLKDNGGIFIDLDLKYSRDVDTRQHTKEHILDLISLLYLEELKELFTFDSTKNFPIYIFEKPNVNKVTDPSVTKDGIHIIIGIQMSHIMQCMLREKVMSKIGDIWELPIVNTWDSVFDEGISKGGTNWQMFGSRKPGNEAYELTQYYVISYDSRDGEFMIDEKKLTDIDLSKNLFNLSAQYPDHVIFEINPKIKQEYDEKCKTGIKKIKKPTSKNKIKLLCEGDDDVLENIQLEEIDSPEKLQKAIDKIMNNLTLNEYYVKETHDYTQILPAKYYEPGSHLLNRQVAFALKHTDDRLFLSWVMLRSKASDFDFSSIPSLYHQWNRYFKEKPNGVTKRSLIFWAKQDAFEDYEKIRRKTLEYYIEESLTSPTEYDFAVVLHNMCKERYVCSSLMTSNGFWYVFKNHKWEQDKGDSLRLYISNEMYNAYQNVLASWMNQMQHYDANDDRYVAMSKKVKNGSELSMKLKKTNDKTNIIKEASRIFFDIEFERNVDSNRWLLCFNNGVMDLKNNVFRDGIPTDYVTKSMKINYEPFDTKIEKHALYSKEILSFMETLFPIKELNEYMWEHLASVLIGENKNQTFNIYRGSGSNGKSILTDLMSYTMGDYYGNVPVTLVTEKRPGIGGTSSEIIQLKGVRYAVMQEPSKGAKLNEGMMKQLTGDSTLSGRALYHEQETFTIQFHLVLCTNSLFDVDSNDDGTWRRVCICDFVSKFVDPGEIVENTEKKYQFPKDKELKDKMRNWVEVFASMLVKMAIEKQGNVTKCDIVKASSNKYRQAQDHISAFVTEMVGVKEGKRIKTKELYEEFKVWFQEQQGGRKMPKGTELYDFMNNKFGPVLKIGGKDKGWQNLEILKDDAGDNDDLVDDL